MNAREFFDKIVEMRVAQKGFFATRKGDAAHSQYYADSKRLEAEIDNEIARVQRMFKNSNMT